MSDSASSIADALLERSGQAMAQGDFEAFLACFDQPLVMETFEGKRVLQTPEDLKAVFDAVREFRALNRVVDAVRENVAAEYVNVDTIAATHVSRLFQEGNILFGRPYPAYSIIRRVGTDWKIQFCQYAVDEPYRLNEILTEPI